MSLFSLLYVYMIFYLWYYVPCLIKAQWQRISADFCLFCLFMFISILTMLWYYVSYSIKAQLQRIAVDFCLFCFIYINVVFVFVVVVFLLLLYGRWRSLYRWVIKILEPRITGLTPNPWMYISKGRA